MTRWSAITRTRGRRSALAYGSRSTTAAEDNLNRLVHHERGRYSSETPLTDRTRVRVLIALAGGRMVCPHIPLALAVAEGRRCRPSVACSSPWALWLHHPLH